MSSIRIAGDTSGEIILSAPSVAGTNTITLPAVTGTILTTAYTGDVTFSGDLTVDTNTLYVDSTNNRVGVGKSNPSVPLDVNGITRTANAYSLSYPGVPGSTSAFGAGTISADSNWGMYFRAATGAAIADFAWVNGANTERMRITSTGNVGIGTSSPLGRLSVLGEGRIVTIGDSGTANTPAITARNTADTSYAFLNISTYRTKFFTEGSERMVINESGNVGIGTSSPSEKLDVSGTVKATSFSGSASGLTGIPAPSELSTASGSAPSYSARAWVNFNGTGTVAIRASGNVSSITDSGVGKYTVNFTTAMSDTNYTVAGMAGDSIRAGNVLSLGCNTYSVSQSTSATTIAGLNDAGTLQDKTYANVVVFR